MKILLGIPLLLLFLAALFLLAVGLVAFRFLRIIRKTMRGDYTDEEVERLSQKYYKAKDTYNFDKDYFKTQGSSSTYGSASGGPTKRTTHTSEGVTIIDDRDPNTAKRKIFTKDEGEYVDYQET